jgi:hypothetical protein
MISELVARVKAANSRDLSRVISILPFLQWKCALHYSALTPRHCRHDVGVLMEDGHFARIEQRTPVALFNNRSTPPGT